MYFTSHQDLSVYLSIWILFIFQISFQIYLSIYLSKCTYISFSFSLTISVYLSIYLNYANVFYISLRSIYLTIWIILMFLDLIQDLSQFVHIYLSIYLDEVSDILFFFFCFPDQFLDEKFCQLRFCLCQSLPSLVNIICWSSFQRYSSTPKYWRLIDIEQQTIEITVLLLFTIGFLTLS